MSAPGKKPRRPIALIVLDGWGLRAERNGNAVVLAEKPFFDHLWQTYPHTTLGTGGEDVGLPAGQMGNSEVGHMNLGAGRVVMQDLLRINRSIATGEFFKNEVLRREFQKIAASPASTLHLLGLVSDGGIHSHQEHLVAALKLARDLNVKKTFIHCFTDGRDTAPKAGLGFIEKLETTLKELRYGAIATVSGRFYAMDRDRRWQRIEKAYRAIRFGEGRKHDSARLAVAAAYSAGETDEFITPAVMVDGHGNPVGSLADECGIFFFNFRPDRCRELVTAISAQEFTDFARGERIRYLSLLTMARYQEDYPFPVVFPPFNLSYGLGEILALEGRKQLRAAETEKFPHVTYFFNGGRDQPYVGEDRLLIPSPRDVKTYDEKPEMSAPELAEATTKALRTKDYDFMLLNFANPDMVGHTGVLKAGIKAVETVDRCLKKIVDTVLEKDGALLITADHGNCEQMIAEDGTPHTSHTLNRVPLIYVDAQNKAAIPVHEDGILADIVPTLIPLLELEHTPSCEKAKSLITGRKLFNVMGKKR